MKKTSLFYAFALISLAFLGKEVRAASRQYFAQKATSTAAAARPTAASSASATHVTPHTTPKVAVKAANDEKKVSAEETKKQQCGICFDDKNNTDMCVLGCAHKYCKACLSHILDDAIKAKNAATLRCPDPACRKEFQPADFAKITADRRKIEALGNIQFYGWLAQQKDAKHCPTRDCPYVFIKDNDNRENVTCPVCHKEYCANCLLKHSDRVPCKEAIEIQKLNGKDADKKDAAWIETNTKPCPRCKSPIEKVDDGSCDWVVCEKCNYGFCYQCFRSNHGHTWGCTREPLKDPMVQNDEKDENEQDYRPIPVIAQQQNDEKDENEQEYRPIPVIAQQEWLEPSEAIREIAMYYLMRHPEKYRGENVWMIDGRDADLGLALRELFKLNRIELTDALRQQLAEVADFYAAGHDDIPYNIQQAIDQLRGLNNRDQGNGANAAFNQALLEAAQWQALFQAIARGREVLGQQVQERLEAERKALAEAEQEKRWEEEKQAEHIAQLKREDDAALAAFNAQQEQAKAAKLAAQQKAAAQAARTKQAAEQKAAREKQVAAEAKTAAPQRPVPAQTVHAQARTGFAQALNFFRAADTKAAASATPNRTPMGPTATPAVLHATTKPLHHVGRI